jgi:hypothetical protein
VAQFPRDAQVLIVVRLLQKVMPTAANFASVLVQESLVNAFR